MTEPPDERSANNGRVASRVKSPQGRKPARRHGPVFLERETYRQRRLIDAARILPVVGAFLWMVPLLWPRGAVSMSSAMMFVFGIWVFLVAISAVLSRRVHQEADGPQADPSQMGGVATAEGGEGEAR